jgi:hypothetical protein
MRRSSQERRLLVDASEQGPLVLLRALLRHVPTRAAVKAPASVAAPLAPGTRAARIVFVVPATMNVTAVALAASTPRMRLPLSLGQQQLVTATGLGRLLDLSIRLLSDLQLADEFV